MFSKNDYAYLGMYDLPALRPAQDVWWSGLARHLEGVGFSSVPNGLNRSTVDPYDIWLAPNLFFAQTCGYPLTHRLAGKVRLVGTPCYDAPGCEGGLYRSMFIVRTEMAAENLSVALPARVAVNGKDSYSGWRAVSKAVQLLDLKDEPFTETIISGGHIKSIDLVREGIADITAVDGVTLALVRDVEPERLAGTRVLQQCAPAPGLPYVTRADVSDQEVKRMAEATRNAFDDPELAAARRTLRLSGFATIPLQEYDRHMK